MSSDQERGSPQRTLMFGILFVLLLLLAILAGYIFLGKAPAGTAAPTDTPAPLALVPPVAPSDLGADVVAVFDVPVGWKDNSDNEDGFNIYRQRIDLLSAKEKAGDSGKDSTKYLDEGTFCGATYQYIVASYNAAGESPATACWQITLPTCPAPFTLKAAAGDTASPADFYLSADGVSFVADQDGQNGLVDLGDVGTTSLDHVTLPQPADYKKDGVPVVAGHTYAVLMKDGQSVEVFTVNSIDATTADVTGIIWNPGNTISGACQPLGDVTPGGQCINGDKICDPNCTGGPDRDCPTRTETPTITPTPPCVISANTDCVTQTVTETPPPPDCGCRGTDWVCTGQQPIPNDRRCTQPTEPPTLPATDPPQECTAGWVPPTFCTCCGPNKICPDGHVEENHPDCHQGGTDGGGQQCTCVPDSSTAPTGRGHCKENPNIACTP